MKIQDKVYFIEDYKVHTGIITGSMEQTAIESLNGSEPNVISAKEYIVAEIDSLEEFVKFNFVSLSMVSKNKKPEELYATKEEAEKECALLIEKRDELNRKAKEEEQQRIENMAQICLNEIKERYPYSTLEELEHSLLKAFKEQELSIKARKIKYTTEGMIKEK